MGTNTSVENENQYEVTHDDNQGNVETHEKRIELIPPTLLLTFFETVTENLSNYPSATVCDQLLVNKNHTKSNSYEPVSLQVHRKLLLDEQLTVLKDKVSAYNNERSQLNITTVCSLKDDFCKYSQSNLNIVTVDQVQECLTLLGRGVYTHVDKSSSQSLNYVTLKNAIIKMNDAARLAYVRSVLWAELTWLKQYQAPIYSKDDKKNLYTQNCESIVPGYIASLDYSNTNRSLHRKGDGDLNDLKMDQSSIIEFCSLCITAVKLPEVKQYIVNGDAIIFSSMKLISNDDHVDQNYVKTPQDRLVNIQNMLLCALGYDPMYCIEIRDLVQQMQLGNENDFDKTLSEYVTSMQSAVVTFP